MTIDILKEIANKIIALSENLFSGKYGFIKIVMASFVLSLVSCFPSYDVMLKGEFDENWDAIISQTQSPLTPKNYAPSSHASSITLRLTPPVIGKILGLQRKGYLVMQLVTLVLLLYFLIGVAQSITQDKASTAFMALGFGSIFVGNVLMSDIRGMFDVLAYCLITAAMYWSNPILIYLATFLASFTDERALIASGLVFFFWVIRNADFRELSLLKFLKPNQYALAVLLSGISYLAARIVLARLFNLGTQVEGPGLRLAVKQINALPFGLWTGLEGFWLIVSVAALLLYNQRQYVALILGGLFIGAVCLGAMCVFDITRSMAYVFPAAIIGLQIVSLGENNRFLRYLTLCSGFICMFPTYYIGGENYIQWGYPLPLQILRMVFH